MKVPVFLVLVTLALAGCADSGDGDGTSSTTISSKSSTTSTSGNSSAPPTLELTFDSTNFTQYVPFTLNYTINVQGTYDPAFSYLIVADGVNAPSTTDEPVFPFMGSANYTEEGNYTFTATFNLADGTQVKQSQIVNATVTPPAPPRELPPNYEFGPSLGCEGSAGPDACILLIDEGIPVGFKAAIGEAYWGLKFDGSAPPAGDSDCAIVDAAGTVLSEPNNGNGPCAGNVPEGAAFLYVWSYAAPASALTVEFSE